MEGIRIGISRCLLGEKVRYDGGHKWDRYVTDTLGHYFDYVGVCPEVEYGLPIPRESLRLIGDDPASPRLVTTRTAVDHTEGMQAWAEKRLNGLEAEDLCGFIFKSRSPSSGLLGVKVYSSSGMPSMKGVGIFARAFTRRFPLVPVIDDGRLHDPGLRENFIERVFVYKRWQEFLKGGGSLRGLIEFHTTHKLLMMAHSAKHNTALGQLVARAKGQKPHEIQTAYFRLLMEGLGLAATVKKNTNVLMHVMGYFKQELTADEKQELLEVIDRYHRQYVPLIVPITFLNHYVRKYNEPYLKEQYYLNPHPMELMLRNHV
jgi:uncharacterized protein YbgA (DUF1722 family)/uncharacterized protein YbbK (DUF523 family)